MQKSIYLIFLLVLFFSFINTSAQEPIAQVDTEKMLLEVVYNNQEQLTGSGRFNFTMAEIFEPADVGYLNVVVDLNNDRVISQYEVGSGPPQNEWIINNIPFPITDEIFSEPFISVWFSLTDPNIEVPNEFFTSLIITDSPIEPGLPINIEEIPPTWTTGGVFTNNGYWGLNDPLGQELVEIPLFAPIEIPDTITVFEIPGEKDSTGMPDIEQKHNECGPTSAANSLIWLAKNHGFTDKLPQAGGEVDTNQLILDLMEAMTGSNNRPFGGLRGNQLFEGKKKYAEDNGFPITVEGGNQDSSAMGANTFDFIVEELHRGQDIELLVDWPAPGMHWVTVTGYGIVDGKVVLYVHDPDDGKNGKAVWTMEEDSSGNLTGHISNPECDAAWAVAESPKPNNIGQIDFRQLNLELLDGTFELTNLGEITIPFVPADNGQWINILAEHPGNDSYAWIARNIYLPSNEWTSYPQSINVQFPLDLLGIGKNETIDEITWGYNVWNDYQLTAPLPTDVIWSTSVVSLEDFYRFGRILSDTNQVAAVDTNHFGTIIDSLLTLKDVVYISCNEDDPTSLPNIDLDKANRDGELNGCGPAAASNSLMWLLKNHNQIDFPNDHRKAFNHLSNLMKRAKNGTVGDRNFIQAKLDFIEMYNLPITVKYQDDALEGDIKSSTGRTKAVCKDAKNTDYPKKDWMINEAKEDEDVEIGCTWPGGGHWITLNGTYSLGDQTYIFYKDDGKQKVAGGNEQSWTPINVDGSGHMRIPKIHNAEIDIVVSESYDPNYKHPPKTANYEKYCTWTKRIVPPGYKITIEYPDDNNRCYNSTVYTQEKPNGKKKHAVWNFNGGKSRTFVNNEDNPVIVHIHNDDKYSGGGSSLKNDKIKVSYTIEISDAEPSAPEDLTDSSNVDEYGGFSIGADDNSSSEFSDSLDGTVNFDASIGTYLNEFPAMLVGTDFASPGVDNLNITYPVSTFNKYWEDLELNLGVLSFNDPTKLYIDCPTTGFYDSVEVADTGDYIMDIGGLTGSGTFELNLDLEGDGWIEIDNIGIASKVPIVTGVEDSDKLPKEYKLYQNHPNPFNPTTTIEYSLITAEFVELKVYNILGKEVATLVQEIKEPGKHSYVWNIGNLSSGVYIYQIKAGKFTDVKKCIILK